MISHALFPLAPILPCTGETPSVWEASMPAPAPRKFSLAVENLPSLLSASLLNTSEGLSHGSQLETTAVVGLSNLSLPGSLGLCFSGFSFSSLQIPFHSIAPSCPPSFLFPIPWVISKSDISIRSTGVKHLTWPVSVSASGLGLQDTELRFLPCKMGMKESLNP